MQIFEILSNRKKLIILFNNVELQIWIDINIDDYQKELNNQNS